MMVMRTIMDDDDDDVADGNEWMQGTKKTESLGGNLRKNQRQEGSVELTFGTRWEAKTYRDERRRDDR